MPAGLPWIGRHGARRLGHGRSECLVVRPVDLGRGGRLTRAIATVALSLVSTAVFCSPCWSQGEAEPAPQGAASADELAKALANPVASLISVPFQSNFDFGSGPEDDGFRYTLNIQPVVPVSLTDDWNLITRVILPVIY